MHSLPTQILLNPSATLGSFKHFTEKCQFYINRMIAVVSADLTVHGNQIMNAFCYTLPDSHQFNTLMQQYNKWAVICRHTSNNAVDTVQLLVNWWRHASQNRLLSTGEWCHLVSKPTISNHSLVMPDSATKTWKNSCIQIRMYITQKSTGPFLDSKPTNPFQHCWQKTTNTEARHRA